ncbi:MAG: hypothetical protein IPF41_16170 [Flavobacteriales bacterium]|nr:hypothetical protein [Flavobacteriales bacterium]
MQVLNTTIAGVQAYPAVEKRADGGFVVVWEGNGFQGDTQGINARVWSGVSFPGVQAGTNTATVVDETGATGVVELRLGTQPTGNVVVDLSVSDATEASIDVAQLTFTNANWNEPQTVTVTGLDDVLDDGDIDLSVVATINILTADPVYSAMGPENFAVTNRDDDADFTLPADQTFCRDIGMAAVNVMVTNAGRPVATPASPAATRNCGRCRHHRAATERHHLRDERQPRWTMCLAPTSIAHGERCLQLRLQRCLPMSPR